MRKTVVLMAAFVAISVIGCAKLQPAPKPAVGQTVLLKYHFPQGRALYYTTKAQTRMRFTMPFITEPQEVKTETVINMVEEVIQAPLGGYATVEQRIDGFRLLLYQANKLIFDSSRPQDFSPQPQLETIMAIKGTRVRYEINSSGNIRSTEGLQDLSEVVNPANMSQVFQIAQPSLPEGPVVPGQSWNSKREIPLAPGQGMTGAITLSDNTKFMELRKVGDSYQAVIELHRDVTIEFQKPIQVKKKKKMVSVIKGSGESVATIIFDVERGIIVSNEGRIKVSTATAVSDQPSMNQFTLDIEGTMNSILVP